MDVIKTDNKLSPTKDSLTPPTNMAEVTTEGTTTKQSGGGKGSSDDDPDDGSSGGGSSGGSSTAIIGAAAGGAVLLIILVIFIIIFIRRRRRENKSSDTHLYEKPVKYKTSKNKETVNEEQTHQNNPPSSDERDENPNVFTAPSGDVYAKPIKKKPTPDSEYQNGLQNDTYANMQADISAGVDESDGVKISRFLFYVEEMKKNKNFGFEKEFNELPVGQTHPWVVGRRAENVNKNKYKNNAAYDHSRVVLSGEDYINANFIQGIKSEVYIAAQGPVEETVNDFWQMIWEQDCTCIIALTNLVELGKVKCFKYWPDGETSFGEIHVKTVKTELFADYVLRYLDIKKDGRGKKIIQYHFISWPDHGVPKYPTKLLAFRHRFRALHTVSAQPIVVHCSAGIGRTGTFIALDMTLLRLIQLNEQTININETINELRNQRVNMVQTLEQYILVHNAVLETVLCGFTEIVAENLKTEIERLEQKELNKSFTGFEIEFNKLSSVCHPFAPEECMAALLQKNKSKNRDSKIYPTENLRVYLSGSKEEEDPYINATYVHSYTQARAYIATQAPLPNTINDFWQMVFEKKTVVVVMLNNMSEEKTIYPQYWPDNFNEEQKYGDLFVKMVSAETRGPIISRKFVITNKNLKAAVTEHVVRHVQFTDWPEHGVPGNHSDVMDLLDSVEEAQQRSANGAVIVHCSNGAHRTGTYLTLAIQRERLSSEHVIDIFRCIKMLREQRPQFVGNLDQYKFCYDAMLTFVESFTTYDNIPKVQKE
ncbi:receptor-type tyrosine- phosphatase T [Paramuricea clavata]|uniref:protein-tyrosine-phosphatase n=1 Tax=Paramuricea clavata TaxID=317549 RepID=A0A7D9L8A2_PARCT|nr:receptor-type tyrosine- phosphatase T [Paramuricea clavata]